MREGIAIQDTWDFFNEIYAELAAHHETSLFRRRSVSLPVFNARINGRLFRQDMQSFLRAHDVVFFEWASELLAVASHLPKSCGIVSRLHRFEMYQWADKVNWDNVDTLILVSEAKRREFAARFPAHAHKLVVIPEAVSLDKFTPQSKSFSGDLAILGHLRPRKRVYDLVLTFYDLVQQRPDLHLHIGGGRASGFGEYAEALYSLVPRLGLEKNVTFYDHVNNPREWYHRMDILISNSYSEGLQLTPIEAMASECYVLSHNWEGADELLPAENLFFSGRELVEKVIAYSELGDEEQRRRRSNLRRIVAEKCNVDCTKQQVRALVEAAGRRGEPSAGRSAT